MSHGGEFRRSLLLIAFQMRNLSCGLRGAFNRIIGRKCSGVFWGCGSYTVRLGTVGNCLETYFCVTKASDAS